MSKLAVRHATSRANIGEALAFRNGESPLTQRGRHEANELGGILMHRYEVSDISQTPVAVSQLRRSKETAQNAGFQHINEYPLLDEVMVGFLRPNTVPEAAIERAEKILANPPEEPIWVTHGLVIAGLSVVLDITPPPWAMPRLCEVRELPID